MKTKALIFFSLIALIVSCGDQTDYKINTLWSEQWGSSRSEGGSSIAVTESALFISGNSKGDLDESEIIGNTDAFITKLNLDGTKQWTKKWGTPELDVSMSMVVGSSGSIYLTGYTEGNIGENENVGEWDLFLLKFNNDGEEEWARQWGTSGYENAFSVTTDSNENIYVTGYTDRDLDGNENVNTEYVNVSDVFLTKYNSNGEKLWTKQWGSYQDDLARAVVADNSGNIFVTGYTRGNFDGNENSNAPCDFYNYNCSIDVFLTKFNSEGERLWSKQWGTIRNDIGNSITVDSLGNLYVTGETRGSLRGSTNANEPCEEEFGADCLKDMFITKFSNDGEMLWTTQWGETENDYGVSITVDTSDNIFVAGNAYCEDFTGDVENPGACDVFISKYSSSGKKLWIHRWKTSSCDTVGMIKTDRSGNIYLTGSTHGEFGGNPNVGEYDIYVMKLSESQD